MTIVIIDRKIRGAMCTIYKNKRINKNILFNIDKQIRNPNVEIITIPGNLDTKDWGIKAAHYMVDELKERGAIGDEIQY